MRRTSALQCLLYFRFQAAAYKLLYKTDHTRILCIEKCVLRHCQIEAESSRTQEQPCQKRGSGPPRPLSFLQQWERLKKKTVSFIYIAAWLIVFLSWDNLPPPYLTCFLVKKWVRAMDVCSTLNFPFLRASMHGIAGITFSLYFLLPLLHHHYIFCCLPASWQTP